MSHKNTTQRIQSDLNLESYYDIEKYIASIEQEGLIEPPKDMKRVILEKANTIQQHQKFMETYKNPHLQLFTYAAKVGVGMAASLGILISLCAASSQNQLEDMQYTQKTAIFAEQIQKSTDKISNYINHFTLDFTNQKGGNQDDK